MVVGILPLLVETLKAYRSAHGKLRTLRHCSKALHRIQTIFEVRSQIFGNECRLLLQLVLEDNVQAKNMIDDAHHELWYNEEVKARLANCLESSHDLCASLIEDIRTSLVDIEKELRCFDVVTFGRSKVSTLLTTNDSDTIAVNVPL